MPKPLEYGKGFLFAAVIIVLSQIFPNIQIIQNLLIFIFLVLLFGCLSAAKMSFFFVEVKNFFGLLVKCSIDTFEMLCNILMYGTFADSKGLRRGTHSYCGDGA